MLTYVQVIITTKRKGGMKSNIMRLLIVLFDQGNCLYKEFFDKDRSVNSQVYYVLKRLCKVTEGKWQQNWAAWCRNIRDIVSECQAGVTCKGT